MARSNLYLTALIVGVAAFACAEGKPQSESDPARELLLKTLDRNYRSNVIALISQRAPDDSGAMQRIQVQISRDGKIRQTVIYPLSMQGVETIDDGKQSATCLPDEKVILIQDSPRLLPNDTETRINLATRNYGLSLTGSTTVAGHRAMIVVARPRYKGLETRRYHIDDRTGFLLKLETIDSRGVAKLAFQAQQVTYPASISPTVFNVDLDKREGFTIISQRRIGFFDSAPKAPVTVGFEPVLPQSLPFGFDIQDAQINDSGRFKSMAVRITDGLVKATVYQYSLSTARQMKERPGTTIGDGSGIRFVVAADVPEAVRKKILATFIETAKKAESDLPQMGLSWGAELLPSIPTLTAPEDQTLELWQAVRLPGFSLYR